jgi:hypothetical protein
LLNTEKITHKELETLMGRLNHAGFIIPANGSTLPRPTQEGNVCSLSLSEHQPDRQATR